MWIGDGLRSRMLGLITQFRLLFEHRGWRSIARVAAARMHSGGSLSDVGAPADRSHFQLTERR